MPALIEVYRLSYDVPPNADVPISKECPSDSC